LFPASQHHVYIGQPRASSSAAIRPLEGRVGLTGENSTRAESVGTTTEKPKVGRIAEQA
jgi:hypothetical protein